MQVTRKRFRFRSVGWIHLLLKFRCYRWWWLDWFLWHFSVTTPAITLVHFLPDLQKQHAICFHLPCCQFYFVFIDTSVYVFAVGWSNYFAQSGFRRGRGPHLHRQSTVAGICRYCFVRNRRSMVSFDFIPKPWPCQFYGPVQVPHTFDLECSRCSNVLGKKWIYGLQIGCWQIV